MDRNELKKIFNYTCAICDDFVGKDGQCAHIISVSEKKKGPRHYTKIYKNLDHGSAKTVFNNNRNMLYLCYTCHKTIDNNPSNYPVEMLEIHRAICILKHDKVKDMEESKKYNENKKLIKEKAMKIKKNIEYNNKKIDDGDICYLIDFNNTKLTFYDWIEILELLLPYFSTTKDDILSKLNPIFLIFGLNYSLRKVYEKKFIPELIDIIKNRFISGITKSISVLPELTIYPKLYFLVSAQYKEQIINNLKYLNTCTPEQHFKTVNYYIDYYLECCEVTICDGTVMWDNINTKYKKNNKTFAFNLNRMVIGRLVISGEKMLIRERKSRKSIQTDKINKINKTIKTDKRCAYIFRSGDKKGEVCGVVPRGESNYCSTHKKYDETVKKVEKIKLPPKSVNNTCFHIFRSGDRKGERCDKVSKDKSNYCSTHKKYEKTKLIEKTRLVEKIETIELPEKCFHIFRSGDRIDERCDVTPRGRSYFCSAHKKYENSECIYIFRLGDKKGERCGVIPRSASNFCAAHKKYEH